VQYRHILTCAIVLWGGCASQEESTTGGTSDELTVVALGDAGEKNSDLKGNASLIGRMNSGVHDGGRADMILFLGDNFYPTGLNVPVASVEDKANSVLSYFKDPMTELGPDRVHAVAGNHDYYTGHAFEASAFFGLIDIEIGPMGIGDRGNEREAALPEWTYHYGMPSQTVVPLGTNGADSVAFLFFDSARLLRTDPVEWKPALDSLQRLLSASSRRPGISWRVLVAHHPIASVGEHGGWTSWNDETREVDFVTPCDKDTNALGWFKNFIDPEDLCADRYRAYIDSMKTIIGRNDAKVQLVLSGHDHSLQLLSYPERNPECLTCPNVQIISGAASKRASVRKPHPPAEYTGFDMKEMNGESQTGFVQLRFRKEEVVIRFFNGRKGEVIDMGEGRTEFRIDHSGLLITQ